MTQTSIQPLSIGNTVSVAFQLYRDRFVVYSILATRGTFWFLIPLLSLMIFVSIIFSGNGLWLLLFVPIMLPLSLLGMAKYITYLGLISRLGFRSLVAYPETINEALDEVLPKYKSFLKLTLLTYLFKFLIVITSYFSIIIFSAILSFINRLTGGNIFVFVLFILVFIAFLFANLVVSIHLLYRLTLFEIPLAVEPNIKPLDSVKRSYYLTKGFIDRIFTIFVVAGLILLPFQLIISVFLIPFNNLIAPDVSNEEISLASMAISYTLSLPLSNLLNIPILPFWQVLKSAIYYDLRSRKEGLDLQLKQQKNAEEEKLALEGVTPVKRVNFLVSEAARELADRILQSAELSRLQPEDLAAVRDYLQRRSRLAPARKKELALSLARRIRGAIAFQQLPRGVTPNLFLEAVYLADQQR